MATAVLLGLLALAPSALASGSPQGPPAGPTTPPFTQCPAIGEDTTCQYLIDVKSATEPPVIIEDPSQIYYDGSDDVTVAVQNETGLPLSKIHVGVLESGDGIFGFDGDGLCSEEIMPKPSGCPFAPEPNELVAGFTGDGYTGPDTEFKAEGETTDAGTVTFPTPLANDQYTYFTLEAPPYGTTIVAGEVNDTIATKLTAQTEPPTEEARLALLAPVNVTDKATIIGPNVKFAEGEVEYRVYSDAACTKEVANAGTAKVAEGVAEASKPVGASLPTDATYYWQVKYTGSKKGVKTEENSPATSVCGEESMSFGVVPVVTTLSGGGQIGTTLTVAPKTPVTDTATVSAGGQSVYGQIEYKVYSNASCTTEVASGGTVTTTNGIGPSSEPVTLSTPGTYYFQASFTGTKVALTGKSPCGSEVVNVVPPPPPPPTPNSGFGIKSIVGSPNGTVSISFVPTQSGTGTLVVTVPTASIASVSAVDAKSKRCKPGQVKIKHRCLPSTTVTGKASASGTAGVPLTLTVFLSGKVKAQLKKGKTIHLTATLTYQSALGGTAVVASFPVTVKGKRPHHHGRH